LIRQILLTLAVALAVYLVVKARRRAAEVAKHEASDPRFTPQAIAGWVLLLLMIVIAVGSAWLADG